MKRKAMSLILAVVMVLGNCTSAMAMESEEFNVTNQETENLAGENKSAFQDAASDVESDSFLEVSSLVEDKDASVSGDDSVLFEDEMENETETETETETDTEDLTEAKAETDPDNVASQKVLNKCGFEPNGKIGEEGPRFTVYNKLG